VLLAAISPLIGRTLKALNRHLEADNLRQKRIAVLGARGVGKTHFIRFLSTGEIPVAYQQTVARAKVKGRRFKLKDLEINIKDSVDVSGAKDAYAEWKALQEEADLVLYLMRADRLLAGDESVERRVREDLTHIGEWLRSRNRRPMFFIVGTFCDMDPDFKKLTREKAGDYQDKFQRLPIVRELVLRAGGTSLARVVLGSMKTKDLTEQLAASLFEQVFE